MDDFTSHILDKYLKYLIGFKHFYFITSAMYLVFLRTVTNIDLQA